MHVVISWLLCICLVAWCALRDRTIAREPVYETGAPKYLLLVFGPEGKTRVWLVLDGDKLLMDRNANGDLTEAGERVQGGVVESIPERDTLHFDLGELVTGEGRQRVTRLKFGIKGYATDRPLLCGLYPTVVGRFRQSVPSRHFADRPQDAPILRIDGPLTMGLHQQPIFVPGKDTEIDAWIGTRNHVGSSRATPFEIATLVDFTQSNSDMVPGVPAQSYPLIEIEFPRMDPNAAPIRVRAALEKRH
jgi:hypothetical protein